MKEMLDFGFSQLDLNKGFESILTMRKQLNLIDEWGLLKKEF